MSEIELGIREFKHYGMRKFAHRLFSFANRGPLIFRRIVFGIEVAIE